MTTRPRSRYFSAHARTKAKRAEPVDARVRPEVNENDLSSQTPRSERGRAQPASCPFETGQTTLDGEQGRARVPARTKDAHSYATFRPINRSGWRPGAVLGALHAAFSATAGGLVTGPVEDGFACKQRHGRAP